MERAKSETALSLTRRKSNPPRGCHLRVVLTGIIIYPVPTVSSRGGYRIVESLGRIGLRVKGLCIYRAGRSLLVGLGMGWRMARAVCLSNFNVI